MNENKNINLNELTTVTNTTPGFSNNEILDMNQMAYTLNQTVHMMNQTMQMMSQQATISNQNTKNVNALHKDLDSFRMDVKTDIGSIKNEISDIKYNEEITTSQKRKIITAANTRVYQIIGNNALDKAKYYRTFISRLYGDARRYASMGSKIEETRKGDYQRVLNYIEAWNPSQGVAALKKEVDIKAEAKVIAKKLGY